MTYKVQKKEETLPTVVCFDTITSNSLPIINRFTWSSVEQGFKTNSLNDIMMSRPPPADLESTGGCLGGGGAGRAAGTSTGRREIWENSVIGRWRGGGGSSGCLI